MGWSVPRATKEMIKALPDFDYAYDTTQRDKFVDLDFVEEAEKMLLPGKVALVAEVDEEWVVSVDAALEASGGTVFRRARPEVIDTQFDHATGAFKGEIKQLEAEAAHSTGEAKSKLQVQIASAKAGLARAVPRAKRRVEALRQEAAAKALAIKKQLDHAKGEVKGTLEDRVERVKRAYRHAEPSSRKLWV